MGPRHLVKNMSGQLGRYRGSSRHFRTSACLWTAQNFTMPAMSPTMTEGNIASWKIQEGDSFSTGDVLLEIETDKAQMDVEAQEDGKLAKIIQPGGTKGVKVGSRIAITAEEDDNLTTLDLPSEDKSNPPQLDRESTARPSRPSESQVDSPSRPSKPDSSSPSKQRYPLYPSVAQLLHNKGIAQSEAEHIKASGPKGRLLKGDVLAYLGTIRASYASEQSARIEKLGRLNLSGVKSASPKKEVKLSKEAQPEPAAIPPKPELAPNTQVTVAISLSSALTLQKRIHDTLGVSLPLSTLIDRATELANEDLPCSHARTPSADEIFDDVLGLNKIPRSSRSRGHFLPQMIAIPGPVTFNSRKTPPSTDVYDILTGRSPEPRSPAMGRIEDKYNDVRPASNLFGVNTAKGDEKRARAFLERFKTILQVEPGRLII